MFDKVSDFVAFERVIDYAMDRAPTRILAYCLMPNHWHFVLWPREDGELTNLLRRLTHTHTQRWHAHHQTAGTGHLYQGRFKSLPAKADDHLLTVIRYVEERFAGGPGAEGRTMAMVKPVATDQRKRQGVDDSSQVADAHAIGLGQAIAESTGGVNGR